MIKLLIAAVVALGGITALVQHTSAAPKPQLSWIVAPSPEIHRLSAALVGTWRTTEKFEPNEFLKNGAAGTGAFSIRKGPGNSLILDYASQSSGGPYASTRIIYWDSQKRLYRAFYCDSLQPDGCGEAGIGRWRGKDLVFESATQGPSGTLQMTQTFSNISATGFTFSLDLVNQRKIQRGLTIQARRTGASASAVGPGKTWLAQQTATTDSKPQFAWVAPQASENRRLSDVLVGTWKTTENFEADEAHKNDATGTGTFSIRKGPGANSLIVDYTSRSRMGPYSSHRIIYWDNRERQYRAFYCDSMQPTGCGEAGTGRWEDKDLVLASSVQGPHGPVQTTERFSNISSVAFTFSLNLVSEGRERPSLTIQALKGGTRP